jgi:hypothetical protein
MDRRGFLQGILAAAVAPAFVKTAGLLMPVKPIIEIVPAPFAFTGFASDLSFASDLNGRFYVPMLADHIYRSSPIAETLLRGLSVDGGNLAIDPAFR